MTIPTEPIGSIPRPLQLIEAVKILGDHADPRLEPLYQDAIRDTIEGPITAQVTASALQLHRDVIAVLDEEAARLLERRDYYREVERAQASLQAGQHGRFGG